MKKYIHNFLFRVSGSYRRKLLWREINDIADEIRNFLYGHSFNSSAREENKDLLDNIIEKFEFIDYKLSISRNVHNMQIEALDVYYVIKCEKRLQEICNNMSDLLEQITYEKLAHGLQ